MQNRREYWLRVCDKVGYCSILPVRDLLVRGKDRDGRLGLVRGGEFVWLQMISQANNKRTGDSTIEHSKSGSKDRDKRNTLGSDACRAVLKTQWCCSLLSRQFLILISSVMLTGGPCSAFKPAASASHPTMRAIS